ncbi:MAG TPA: DUF1059 domain-containing protein [bacterium]|jgi:predicted small metal-binding protein
MSESKRVVADCRAFPDSKCSLTISGSEEEVLAVAVRHAVNEHGHEDTPELVDMVKGMLKEE